MKNVGSIDRAVRLVAAALLVIAGIYSAGTARYVLWGVSAVPLLTAFFRFCPLWALLHINTYKK